MKVSKLPYRNFEYNIRRAEALARLDGYLEDLLYDEGRKTIKPFLEIPNELAESLGFNRIMERAAEIVKREFEIELQEMEKEKENYEKIAKDAVKRLKPTLLKAKEMLEDLGLVMDQILLEQALVAAVSAFEVYLKELVVSAVALNRRVIKRFYPEISEGLSVSRLEEYDQDAKRTQAEIVASRVKLDINTIKSLLGRLLDSMNVFADKKTELKVSKIFEVRHIIIHQAGFTDPKFKKVTKSKSSIDKQITLTRRYVLDSIKTLKQVAERIEDYVRRSSK